MSTEQVSYESTFYTSSQHTLTIAEVQVQGDVMPTEQVSSESTYYYTIVVKRSCGTRRYCATDAQPV